jgi:hypothetical protein
LCLEFLRQLLAQGTTFGRLLLFRLALEQLMFLRPPSFRLALFRLMLVGRSRPIRLQREALIGRNLDPALDGCAHGDHAAHQFGKLARASARIWK